MKIKIVATTDVGKKRINNEDSYIICPDLILQNWSLHGTPSYVPLNKYGAIFIVADGMGGANAGEIASSIAIKSIKHTFSKDNIKHYLDAQDINGLLYLCIKNADEAINKWTWNDSQTMGMGTTIVLCWIIHQIAYIAWCGDSRCYVFNPSTGFKQLTKDHSLVQELIDTGEISEKEAFVHPDSNIITRALGDVNSQPTPDIITYPLSSNDTILLCSDGLCGYCSNYKLQKILESNYVDVMKCRDALLEYALNSGGEDNICIALASLINDNQNVPAPLTSMKKFFGYLKRLLNVI